MNFLRGLHHFETFAVKARATATFAIWMISFVYGCVSSLILHRPEHEIRLEVIALAVGLTFLSPLASVLITSHEVSPRAARRLRIPRGTHQSTADIIVDIPAPDALERDLTSPVRSAIVSLTDIEVVEFAECAVVPSGLDQAS